MTDRFAAFSGIGMRQTAQGTPLANADIDTRDKCTITREEVVERRDYRDCRDEDQTDSKIQTRLARWTFDYTEITPQILARWSAYKLGAATAPTGTPADEVQTLTRSGTVSGGTFTLAMTLEGRTVTTKPIAWDATTAAIQSAMTASRMLFIHPGDVVVTGDWITGMILTFPNTGRLGRADLPLLVADSALITGGGSILVAETTPGDQNFFAFARSTTRVLPFFSFCLGWENDADRVEKYIDLVVESLAPTLSRDGDVGLQVTVVGPWDFDTIEEAFAIPDCVSIDALQTTDCRIQIDSVFQTEDIVSLTSPVGNAIPLDRTSAFPFDGIDVQTLERGRQPTYGPVVSSIFGSEVDSLFQLAYNERTETPVPVVVHFGMPGNRTTWLFPNTQVRFQTNRMGEGGEARYSTIQIEGVPFKDGVNAPFDVEAYLNQTAPFLDI